MRGFGFLFHYKKNSLETLPFCDKFYGHIIYFQKNSSRVEVTKKSFGGIYWDQIIVSRRIYEGYETQPSKNIVQCEMLFV